MTSRSDYADDVGIVRIGNGLCRVDIKNRAKRQRFVGKPEFQVIGDRVIFPETLHSSMKEALAEKAPKRVVRDTQTALVF